MPINPKLLAAMRAHKATKGKNPDPIANPVQNAEGDEADYPGEGDKGPVTDNGATNHREKAAHHLTQVQKRAKGALAVHAKLAAHHHNAYCKAMGH